MDELFVRIHNVETGEIIDREMNEIEFSDWENQKSEELAKNEELQKIALAKNALLEKLGITEEEAKLLLS